MLNRLACVCCLVSVVACAAPRGAPGVAANFALADAAQPSAPVVAEVGDVVESVEAVEAVEAAELAAPAELERLAPAAALDEPVHNGVRSIEILYGFRALDEDDWEPVDQQTAIGLMFAMQGEDAIIGFETGLMLSFDEDEIGAADVDATLGEIYVGAHRTFGTSAWFARPYVGAGVSLIRAALEIDAPGNDVDDDDSSVGFYAHGGVAFRLGDSLSLGVDGRFLGGTDLELFGGDTDVDYLQLGVFLGIDI